MAASAVPTGGQGDLPESLFPHGDHFPALIAAQQPTLWRNRVLVARLGGLGGTQAALPPLSQGRCRLDF
jgi:hypothetical protein